MRSWRWSSVTTSESTGLVPACFTTSRRPKIWRRTSALIWRAKLPSYRGDSRFTTWLYRVVVNAARDRLRRARARGLYERGYVETEALVRAGREGQDDRAQESAWLRQAMRRLPDELRITVLLLLEEDLKHAEAAEILGVSEATVSWRMHEVRKRLRALAADEEEMVS